MATKAKQTVTTTKTRQKKYDGVTTKKCSNCGGDGVVKVRKTKS